MNTGSTRPVEVDKHRRGEANDEVGAKPVIPRREDYHRLLACFDSDPARAAQKYNRLREKLIFFFDRRGCHDADLQTDEAFSRAARWEGNEPIKDVINFMYGVAANQLLEIQRKRSRDPAQLGEIAEVMDASARNGVQLDCEENALLEIQLQCLDSCLEVVARKEKDFLLDYYREQKGLKVELRKQLARRHGVGSGTLRTRLHRLRAKVGDCCKACVAETLANLKQL